MPITSPVSPVVAVPPDRPIHPDPVERHASMSFAETAQATLGLKGTGAELANPAKLGAMAVESLKGYSERAQKAQEHLKDLTRRRERVGGAEGASSGDDGAGAMHLGPAREPFISSEDDLKLISKPQEIGGESRKAGWEDFLKQLEAIVISANFRAESLMIATGVGAMTRSINTLIKGQ